mmetsp:Transcript_41050/g.131981  ORF Transcript_41050/g.131981 Transcript_41050/m.131981 type:complete len:203 (-) Transcript_41050:2-610(-)
MYRGAGLDATQEGGRSGMHQRRDHQTRRDRVQDLAQHPAEGPAPSGRPVRGAIGGAYGRVRKRRAEHGGRGLRRTGWALELPKSFELQTSKVGVQRRATTLPARRAAISAIVPHVHRPVLRDELDAVIASEQEVHLELRDTLALLPARAQHCHRSGPLRAQRRRRGAPSVAWGSLLACRRVRFGRRRLARGAGPSVVPGGGS